MGEKNAQFLFLKLGAEHTGLLRTIILRIKFIIDILFTRYFTRKKKKIGKQNTPPDAELFHLNLIKLGYTIGGKKGKKDNPRTKA